MKANLKLFYEKCRSPDPLTSKLASYLPQVKDCTFWTPLLPPETPLPRFPLITPRSLLNHLILFTTATDFSPWELPSCSVSAWIPHVGIVSSQEKLWETAMGGKHSTRVLQANTRGPFCATHFARTLSSSRWVCDARDSTWSTSRVVCIRCSWSSSVDRASLVPITHSLPCFSGLLTLLCSFFSFLNWCCPLPGSFVH